jgi:DNA-binding transcriptional regulator YdaS (Cro superfamily)
MKTGIEVALEKFDGSPTRLAEAIGGSVLRQHVEHWLKVGRVPTEHAAAVEAATDFSVMRWDLRPDDWLRIWPELAQHPSAPHLQQAEAGA